MNEIQLTQKPIITHDLVRVGLSVTERLAALNLENQVATDDTIQSLKKLRAELNKEFTEYEAQRKAIKDAVMLPYNELDQVYKTEISDKYVDAGNLLKDKIASFENKVKAERLTTIKDYFAEVCQNEQIDFLQFSQTGIEVNLSTSEKKYKEQCAEFVQKVRDDLDLIDTQDFKAEIIVEYKETRNASRAIKTIQDRKEKERLERERIQRAELTLRKARLVTIGMEYDEFTNSYVFGDLSISVDQLENISKDAFASKVFEYAPIIAQEIASMKASVEPEEPVLSDEKGYMARPAPMEPIQTRRTITPVVQAPLQAPVVEAKPELATASFEVTGTMAQLKALKNFLITNNITYKNID